MSFVAVVLTLCTRRACALRNSVIRWKCVTNGVSV